MKKLMVIFSTLRILTNNNEPAQNKSNQASAKYAEHAASSGNIFANSRYVFG